MYRNDKAFEIVSEQPLKNTAAGPNVLTELGQVNWPLSAFDFCFSFHIFSGFILHNIFKLTLVPIAAVLVLHGSSTAKTFSSQPGQECYHRQASSLPF